VALTLQLSDAIFGYRGLRGGRKGEGKKGGMGRGGKGKRRRAAEGGGRGKAERTCNRAADWLRPALLPSFCEVCFTEKGTGRT